MISTVLARPVLTVSLNPKMPTERASRKPTIVPAISSATVIAAQQAGKYDVTSGAYVAYMLADAQQHANLRIIAPGSNMAPLTQEVMVPPGSPIQNVRELKGKKIGVNALNNVGTLLISSLLSDNGVALNPSRRGVVGQLVA